MFSKFFCLNQNSAEMIEVKIKILKLKTKSVANNGN